MQEVKVSNRSRTRPRFQSARVRKWVGGHVLAEEKSLMSLWQVRVEKVEHLWPGFTSTGRPLSVCKVRITLPKDCGSPRSRSARLFMWHRLLPHAAPVLTKHPASVDRVGGRRCSSWGSRRKSRQSGSHPVGFVAQRRGGRTRVRSGADGQSRMAPAGRYVERLGVV